MLPADAVINMDLLHKVIHAGHSRVPVYSESRQASRLRAARCVNATSCPSRMAAGAELLRSCCCSAHTFAHLPFTFCFAFQNILGLILVKELLLVDENAGLTVKQLRLHELPFIR